MSEEQRITDCLLDLGRKTEKLKQIKLICDMTFQTHEPTLEEESRKRYDALFEIRELSSIG